LPSTSWRFGFGFVKVGCLDYFGPLLIPEEAAPYSGIMPPPCNGMMPPPDSEMISPPITE
jgi:hypothetical protein